MRRAELLINHGGLIGEGIRWDEADSMLYWVDLLDNKIFSYDIYSKTSKIWDIDQNTGCLAIREKGGLVAALQHGIYFLDMETGDKKLIADPEYDKPGNRFNDGICDCKGRLWAGTMSKLLDSGEGDMTPRGALYLINSDYCVKKMLDNVTLSNGIDFSPDNKTLYFIDSPKYTVDAFDFNDESGDICNRRSVIHVSEELGMPDGMTVDSEGMIWVGMWGGGSVICFNPNNGEIIEKIPIPAKNVTTMAFGGVNMDEMFVTTAKLNTDLAQYPNAGGVFKIKMDVKGKFNYKFKG